MLRNPLFWLILALFGLIPTHLALATTTPEALRESIDAKSKELEDISKEIEKTQEKLEETEDTKRSLEKEIRNIDYSIRQLNLNIESGEIRVDKLGLEIEEIAFEIEEIEADIVQKKGAITQLIRELWQKEREGTLFILLKHDSLADGFLENQAIHDLNDKLSFQIADLRTAKSQLGEKLDDTENKKGGIERENRNLKYRKGIVVDKKAEQKTVLAVTKQQEVLYEQQIDELEEKQKEIGEAIEKFEEALRAAFDPSLLPRKRPGVIGYPVSVKHLFMTQRYGGTRFARTAYKSKFHNGLDFRAPLGTPILAAEDGIASAVDNNDRGTSRWRRYQYGKYVIVEHNNNLSTLYAHLSRQVVDEGDIIKRGDIIGYSGNTGYSTGAHLHFGVYWTPSIQYKSIRPAAGLVPVGVTIDPEDYL